MLLPAQLQVTEVLLHLLPLIHLQGLLSIHVVVPSLLDKHILPG